MQSLLNRSKVTPMSQPYQMDRAEEFARTLLRSLGYHDALKEAEKYHSPSIVHALKYLRSRKSSCH